MSQSPAIIHCENVSKHYAGLPVLSEISLEIAAGASVALVGGNGAGKTTLFKCLLDFVRPEQGVITIAGVAAADRRARRDIAYLPENFLPPYYLRGVDFLRYMRQLHGVSYAPDLLDEVLQRLDLDAKALQRNVRHYSKGMAQKLGLAACFLSGKGLLLLDEPMTGLDPRARLGVKQLLARLRQRGATLFFSTHLLADVDEICDRLVILHDRRILFYGTPAECRVAYGGQTLEQTYMNCVTGAAGKMDGSPQTATAAPGNAGGK